ncbi:MAG: methyltransferase domain-containing protein [Verrucomicrobia subdivision 3 bacterium]|nr:methyltransferase domain-containing protein [Limisphaerales bacterium]
MNASRKNCLLAVANALSWPWRLLPARWREGILTGLFILDSRGEPRGGLAQMLRLQDRLDWVTNERAVAFGEGVHPKHRLTRYHDFFVEHIPEGARVLDIGCGVGAVARSIATRVKGCEVVGVDRDEGRLAEARAVDNPDNLSFVKTDVCDSLPDGPWQAVVLSNVLEHIEDRVNFLKAILENAQPKRVLIRVPHFERDWKMPMRKELGLKFFSDAEHFIEHRLDELNAELAAAGLRPTVTHTLWGEIWMCCERIESDRQ